MKHLVLKIAVATSIWLAASMCGPARAQQFNSDSWISKPHGMATVILTAGERTTMWMTTFSLFPNWEFTAAAYVYNDDGDPATDDGYSTSFYAKYMFYQNQSATGGAAVKAGTGLDPGYLDATVGLKDAFHTYWMNAPCTLPLFDNKVSWDLMPGASVTLDYGAQGNTAWAFSYSTRVAWYPTSPELSFVGEVFGAAGEAENTPDYKVGLRWEPNQYVTWALTYGQEFNDGPNGAGFEIGIMLFTPPFLKL
jgi:hypothetical protein